MCGIIGICNGEQAAARVQEALPLLHNRGKDACNVLSLNSTSALGHTLHAVVGHVPQPLQKEGILVANCEIYNWKELQQKYKFAARNDAELLLSFLDQFGVEKIEELDGVFALAYWKNGFLTLARDILGEKPLWYAFENGSFAFASEKKVLLALGYTVIQELNPRTLLFFDEQKKIMTEKRRDFFSFFPEHAAPYEVLREKTQTLLHEAIQKRLPGQKFGLLFSGGVDSTYVAKYLKDHGQDFTCYTAVLDTEKAAPDLVAAEQAAQELGLQLRVRKITLNEIPGYLKKIVPLLEDSNVVKVGVALPFYLACEMAKEDGCKVVFSGLGSEEIFAGYERHTHAQNINQECLSGLRKLYERDLYRDDVVTMGHSLELRLPFLDRRLMDFALKIPGEYKLRDGKTKFILRDIARASGIPESIAFRKKKAAQYGSRMDYALGKLAKQAGFSSKSAYLRTFYPSPNLHLGVLFSSGKDSTYAAYIMQRQNYELSCLITLKSRNPDSFMFHTPALNMAPLQAEAMGLPLILQETAGEKEKELEDLRKALQRAKEEFKIEGIVTGALFSTYQRDRIEQLCDELGLKVFSPLWHKPQEKELQELLLNGFEIIFTAIAAEGLDASWLQRPLHEEDILHLIALSEKYGLNPAGEGGETESLVLDCPLFKKKIEIVKAHQVMDSPCSGRLVVAEARLVEKTVPRAIVPQRETNLTALEKETEPISA
ncbi:MAG: diphthine--ammonia ligase [Nanoarchaeota archaeon]|nr:diphthine--ammonia ligase [Nanoarchaeota archaeon]